MGRVFQKELRKQIQDKQRLKTLQKQRAARDAKEELYQRQLSDQQHFKAQKHVQQKQISLLRKRLEAQKMEKGVNQKIKMQINLQEAEILREKIRRDEKRMRQFDEAINQRKKRFLRGLSSQIDKKLERKRRERKLDKEMELRNPGMLTTGEQVKFFDAEQCRDWCRRLKEMERQRVAGEGK